MISFAKSHYVSYDFNLTSQTPLQSFEIVNHNSKTQLKRTEISYFWWPSRPMTCLRSAYDMLAIWASLCRLLVKLDGIVIHDNSKTC